MIGPRRAILLAALVGLLPGAAWAQAPGTGIRGTKHDFAGFGTPASGLCTFCHTPHRASSTTLLWNHRLSLNTFQWDVPSTTAGTPFPFFKGDTYRGPSAKCLSCHDGSVATGDVGWWNGDRGSFPQGRIPPRDPSNIGLGGNLAGNHPVAMPYPYRQARNTYNNVRTGSAINLREWQPDPTTLGIRLFHDDGGGGIVAGPATVRTGIECSSCHDPHNRASVDDKFLLGYLGGTGTEYLCLKCHIK
jgi:doubled CXXCH motif protein